MIDWILAQPFGLAVALLTAVACFRSQCTYWLGRGIHAGVIRAAWAQRLQEKHGAKAMDKLERWGWPVLPLAFLTVGFQTAVHLSAGLLAWRWPRYTLASSIGWLAWGTVYAAGGLAVWSVIMGIVSASPVLVVASAKVLACVVLLLVFVRSATLRTRVKTALNTYQA
ncbi:MAG: hypothetical protein LBR21_05105 [Propionibacteriaceae bacterium]|nr:hypothetical protein [Propionibacteriaceae bacterium]